ncbi:MAG: hypothetical protein J0L78_08940 [Planctomycetes bacterium]|nr:hypothetical protein [Planctomycetota bacterium]
MRTKIAVFASAALTAGCAWAQMTAVIPPAAEGVAGNSGISIPIGNFGSGTFQVMYSPDQLAAIPRGSTISGMQLRLFNVATAAYPPTSRTLSKFEVRFATSTLTPATMSTTFASNMSGVVVVRSGGTTINAGDCPAGNSGTVPEDWSSVIPFSVAYVYNGGPLVVEFRTQSPTTTDHYADILAAPGKAAWATASSSTAASSTSLVQNAGLVMRLTYTPPAHELAHGVTKVTVIDEAVTSPTLAGSPTLTANTPKTLMTVVEEEQFDTLAPGSRIVGMTWRNRADAIWPPAAANYSAFSVQMGRSLNTPAAASPTFASNFAPGSRITRSGGLSFPANSFKPMVGFNVGWFGHEVAFTNPVEYVNGPLAWVIRHSGQPLDEWLFDSQPTDGPFYGTRFTSFVANGSGATVAAGQASADITRLSIDAGAASPLGSAGPGADTVGGDLFPALQTIIAASELRHIPPGSVIDSLWLRQCRFTVSEPATDVTAADMEVTLSTAARRPDSMSQTFAINEGADKVLVHDGPMVLPAGTLPGDADGRFGRLVQFRRNFVYKGGDLCIRIRHTGLSGSIGRLEGLFGTEGFNRCVYSLSSGSSTGNFFVNGYSGLAMRVGYIPSVMTPNALALSNGVGGWTTPGQSEYTIQVIIAADQLRAMTYGSVINGLSLRQGSVSNAVSFPSATTTLPRFDVTISAAARTPLTMSDTFATNMGTPSREVRSGPLDVPLNAFPSSGAAAIGSENAWYVSFERGFVYRGTDLCVTIRGEGVLAASGMLDGEGSFPSMSGATRYRYGDADATTGLSWGPPAIRLAFTPRAFCPADLNNDGQVDDADFVLFIAAYNVLDCADGAMAFGCPSDFNYNRLVDDADFVVFVAAYNALVCP